MMKLKILTEDDYQLSATTFKPVQPLSHTVIINCATGVKQHFYYNFAKYLSERGFQVYTYDYRGIGESLQGKIKSVQADFKVWAELDYTAIIRYAQRENPENKLTVIGHSLGGQLIGLTAASASADNFILIGCQTPYWKHYTGFMKLKVWMLWHMLIPGLTPLFGYFPSRMLRLFENVPRQAATQWARWGKSKNYLFDDYPNARQHFETLAQPALIFSFSDDTIAPIKAVNNLLFYYANLQKVHHHIVPADIERKKIGHFNFFRRDYSNPFWITVTQWLFDKTMERESTARRKNRAA